MQSKNTASVFFVRSSQDANVFYLLQPRGDGTLACQCKAATFRRTPCRHVKAVVAGECLTAQPKRKVPSPGPSPARGEGTSNPFQRQDDGVARGGRSWS